ncbi:Calx-beta domain-containing protein [Psychroserpens sp. SPM9]|uniref:Calx-beta domain-containing protein n=1 Tax=Psychroserpens sp. SPM9 TaxID=2975598 RepID=UPI0021A387AC|nr:Calx-beta domain-containing protein [Psychroserpens sp. SPM9]MDG5490502.1 hypothetical protein [Psychroserpens sp. SPM9]
MKKNYSLVFLAMLCFVVSSYGQTEIFNVNGGGTLPADWSETNNITNEPIDKSTYYMVQPGNPGDFLETAAYDLSAYANATFEVDMRSFGSGTHRALLVEVSTDGGTNFTQSYSTPITTTTYITRTVNIATVSNNTVLRFSADGTSGRGIRMRNLILTAIPPSGPSITANPTTITGLDYAFGNGPSASQSFDIEGTLLVAGTTVTSNSTDFEVSLSPGSGYANSVNVPAGTLNGITTIYTRLVAGLAVNTYSSTISISNATPGIGTTPTINVSGEVTPPPPANDDCSGAISLTPTLTCSYSTYTNFNATDSSSETAPGCASYNGGDVWFSVLVPASGELTIDTNNIDFTDGGMAVYSGACGSLALIECDDDDSTNGNMPYISRNDFTPGTTVYIRVWEYGGNDSGDFGICVTAPAPPNTTVDFSSATYTVNENGGSIDLCVDISAPSASVSTFVDVDLTSTNVPHVTYTLTTLEFTAGSSAQQCVTIPITDNTSCGDSKNYAFELTNVTGGDAATAGSLDATVLTVTDNESTGGTIRTLAFETGDDWTYTGGGTVNSTANKFNGTASYRLSNSTNITTSDFDISAYTNVKLYVAFAANGPDSNEDLFLDISYDGGTTWTGTGSIMLVDGFSNSPLDIGDTSASDPTTVASNPWVASIPDSESQISVRLRTAGLDGGEFYFVDDIILTGDYCAPCTPTQTVTNFTPTSGPAGTEVTITGTNLSTAVVYFGLDLATIVSQTNTEIVVEVPDGATTGAITVEESGCPVDTADFTIISTSGPCNGLDDLIMTEIYDAESGSLGYIEVFNGTGATIDLSTYYIRRYGNATRLASDTYTDYLFPSISITSGQVLYGKISTDTDTASPDFQFTASGGSAGINGADIFHLRNGSTVIDIYVEPNTDAEGDKGYVARRDVNTMGPNNPDDPADWSHLSTENESNLGTFAFTGTVANFLTVDTHPNDVSGCGDAVFTTTATPGNAGTLTYQWYFNDGVSTGWTTVTSGNLPLATVSGETSNQLTLSGNYFSYTGYQFYCLVTEDGTCDNASDAAQLKSVVVTWSSGQWNWSNSATNVNPPTISEIVIIDDTYDTTANGDIDACQLVINSGVGRTLNVTNSHYVRVVNNVINNGTLTVQTHGAFVQDGLGLAGTGTAGTFTNNGTASVIKQTEILNDWYEYTYWSSPVLNQDLNAATPFTPATRRFYFDTSNYWDEHTDGTTNGVPDDIDDAPPYDWQNASGDTMEMGRGYAATSSPMGLYPGTDQATFEGEFFTGDLFKSVIRNGFAGDNDWNFIGNPYASAIDFVDLYTENSTIIDGAAYLWAQSLPPLDTNPGNEPLNFNQADYAIITVGSGNTAGANMVTPNNFIPSGQGFFVSAINTGGNLRFTNEMRRADNTSNDQFFRFSDPEDNAIAYDTNRLWVNLTSDNGVFNQILVAYVDGATNGEDSWSYDAPRNLSSGLASVIYTFIDNVDTRYAIQGKAPSSLTLDEVIPVGFKTNITQATIYKLSIADLEGEFLSNNTIYLKDKLLNTIHVLSDSDYTFTSETGDFTERFEIVFRQESLSVTENEVSPNDVSIVELGDGDVEISVGQNLVIKRVEIIDVVGRTIYQLQGNSSVEVYNLSRLSQAAYIARITLSNGQIITKKAIKRK